MDRLGVLLSVAEAASQEHSPADLVRLSCLPSRWPSCYLCAWYFRRYACVQAHSLSATRHGLEDQLQRLEWGLAHGPRARPRPRWS
jgi:hypothetical protein